MDYLPNRQRRTPQSRLLTVVIPVKDEDHEVLVKLLYDIDAYGWETVVVDDGSKEPVMGADIRFENSQGYGAALKAGVKAANTDLVATVDSDGQHTAWDIKRLEDFMVYFNDNRPDLGHQNVDMVIGDRRLKERSLKRYLGRKGLNWLASLFAGRWINDLNSGLRMFKRSIALGYEPILCNGFSYTTSLTLSMMADGYTVDFLPIKVWPRKYGQTKVRLLRDGWITLRTILWIGIALRTRTLRRWLRAVYPRR